MKLSEHSHSQQAHPSEEKSTYQTRDGEKRKEDNRELPLSEIPAWGYVNTGGGGSTHKKLPALRLDHLNCKIGLEVASHRLNGLLQPRGCHLGSKSVPLTDFRKFPLSRREGRKKKAALSEEGATQSEIS